MDGLTDAFDGRAADAVDAGVTHTLEMDGVQLAFGDRRVLQSVYVKLTAGRVTGLLGRNGCGKSSLMRIMYGSLDAERSVRIDGEWVDRAYRHGVLFAPQHGFIPGGRRVRGVVKDCRLDFGQLVSHFPAFEGLYSQRVSSLSGGERRILEVFSVLASGDARFCLLDEPFSQLSPLHAGILRSMITAAARCDGKGILISDHLYKDVCAVSDELYVLAAGTTYPVATDSPDSSDELRRYGYIK